jgi:GAF domain-containing protein
MESLSGVEKMDEEIKRDREVVLRDWRLKVLNGFLIVVAFASVPAYVVTVLRSLGSQNFWQVIISFSVVELVLIVLAVFRNLKYRIRVIGLLVVGYAAAIFSLRLGGLLGAAPLYLFVLPVVALILAGRLAGIYSTVLSVFLAGLFAYLFSRGIFKEVEIAGNTWGSLGTTLMLLAVGMVLLILFYRFQESLIDQGSSEQAQLIKAQSLLEEQKQNLELTVQARTAELLKSNKIQTALYKITYAASNWQDVQDFYREIHRVIGELMYAKNMFIALYDKATGLLSFPYFVDEKDEPFPSQPLENFSGMTSYMIRTGNPIQHGRDQINQLLASGEVVWHGAPNVDHVGAPLISEGDIQGAILIQSYTEGIHYTGQDEEVLGFVAQHIATALARRRALEAERQRTEELAILNSVSAEVTKSLDVNTVTHLVGDKMREIFGSDSSQIMLLDRDTNLIHVAYEYDKNEGGYIDYVEPFPLGTGLSSKVITTGKPLLCSTLEDEQANGAYFPPEIIEQGTGAFGQSWLGVPIVAKDQVLGLMALADNRPHAFSQNNLHLLQTLSSAISASLENVRLFQAEQQRAAELAIINSVQAGLASQLDIQAIYELVGEKIREIFDANAVVLATFDLEKNIMHRRYEIEQGKRHYLEPMPIPRIWQNFIQDGRSLLVNHDVQGIIQRIDPEFKAPAGEIPKSLLAVPIRIQDRLFGAISLQNIERENAFRESDVHLLETLANSLSIALENARLFDETQRLLKETEQRAAELAIINSVQAALSSQLDMEAIYKLVGEKIREIFDANVVVLVTFDLEKNLEYWHYAIEQGKRFYLEPSPIPKIWSNFIQRGQPIWVNDHFLEWALQIDPDFEVPGGQVPKCVVVVPIRSQGKLIGAISLQNVEHENAFSGADLSLLETLANSLSVALENAHLFNETQRLFQAEQQRAAELAIINSIQAGLASQLDMHAVYELVGEKIRNIFKANTVVLATFDSEKNLMHRHYEYEDGKRFHTGTIPTPNYWRYFIQQDRSYLINDHLLEFMKAIDSEFKAPAGEVPKSAVSVPIRIRDKLQGVISLQNIDLENAFNESDLHLLETLANSMSVALENARLFEQAEQRAAELSAVNTVSSALASELDLNALIQLVGEQTRSVFNADIAFVALLDETSQTIAFPYSYGEEFASIPFGEGLTSKIIQSNQPLLINEELDRQVSEMGATLVGRRARSFLGVPITVSGKAVGILSVQNCSEEGMFDQDDVRLLSTIATSVGNAINNAELFQKAQKSQADAEQANSAKSVFLANMSHELRTPLNAIIGFTRIVRRKGEGLLPEKQLENLDKVLVSAENLLDLINSVLDISKIEAGRMDVIAANFRISALIDLCINTAQPLLQPGVTLEKHVEEGLEIVHSDQDKIRQIVLNLLSNAAKFTQQGKISLDARREGDQILRISVADTGIGISAEALPRVFKEFEQADATTTRKYGGTGLGLTISRNLAHLLGGDLIAESTLGEGSTFTLVIPIHYRAKLEQV